MYWQSSYSVDFPFSLPPTGIWYFWVLEQRLSKSTPKVFWLYLPDCLLALKCHKAVWSLTVWVTPARDHLLLATSWVMIRPKRVEGYVYINLENSGFCQDRFWTWRSFLSSNGNFRPAWLVHSPNDSLAKGGSKEFKLDSDSAIWIFCWTDMILDHKCNGHLDKYTAHQGATCANVGYNGSLYVSEKYPFPSCTCPFLIKVLGMDRGYLGKN